MIPTGFLFIPVAFDGFVVDHGLLYYLVVVQIRVLVEILIESAAALQLLGLSIMSDSSASTSRAVPNLILISSFAVRFFTPDFRVLSELSVPEISELSGLRLSAAKTLSIGYLKS